MDSEATLKEEIGYKKVQIRGYDWFPLFLL